MVINRKRNNWSSWNQSQRQSKEPWLGLFSCYSY